MATHHTSVFVEATPVAVFSIMADVENRSHVISRIRRVALQTRPPVSHGTRFREWRKSIIPGWGRSYIINDYQPPDRMSLVLWQAGIRLEATLRLKNEHGGTQINVDVSGRCPLWRRFPISMLADQFSRQWMFRLESDLADIKRQASMRGNPNWRDKLKPKDNPITRKPRHSGET